jgi:hypothetical protein
MFDVHQPFPAYFARSLGFSILPVGLLGTSSKMTAGLCGPGYGGAENRQQLVSDRNEGFRWQIVIGDAADEPDEFMFEVHRIPRDRLDEGLAG